MPGLNTIMRVTKWGLVGKTALVLIMLLNGVVVADLIISIGARSFQLSFLLFIASITSAWISAALLADNGSTAKPRVLCSKPCCMAVYRLYPPEYRNTGGVLCPLWTSHGDCPLLLKELRRDSTN